MIVFREPLENKWTRPYRVIGIKDKCVLLDPNGSKHQVSIYKMKAYKPSISSEYTCIPQLLRKHPLSPIWNLAKSRFGTIQPHTVMCLTGCDLLFLGSQKIWLTSRQNLRHPIRILQSLTRRMSKFSWPKL